MASTNKTKNLALSQFTATDKPSWLTDYNNDMAKIDTLVPTGAVMPYAGTTVPQGWLFCDGAAVSRTTYAALFAAIGTTFGAGDAKTTFNLPNMSNRFPLGGSSSKAAGAVGGSETHTLAVNEIPPHNHMLPINYGANNGTVRGVNGWSDKGIYDNTWVYTAAAAGGGTAHNNMPPYLVMKYIVKI